MLRRREERLGRDAPDVHAGAAERLVHLDADDVESELRRADRSDVTAGPATDHDDVRLLHPSTWHGATPVIPSCASQSRASISARMKRSAVRFTDSRGTVWSVSDERVRAAVLSLADRAPAFLDYDRWLYFRSRDGMRRL